MGYQASIESALELFAAQRWVEARRAFERAHALRPSARTWRGIAFASYYAGDHESAANAFERSLRDMRHPLTATQRRECRAYLARAQAHTGRLRVSVEPVDAGLFLDDRPLQVDGPLIHINPGSHHLRVARSGYLSVVRELDVAGGDQLELHVLLRPTRTAPQGPSAPAGAETLPASPTTQRAGRGQLPTTIGPSNSRAVLWVSAGVTLALGVSAAVFGELAVNGFESVKEQCEHNGCDRAERARLWDQEDVDPFKTLTTASLIGAGLGLAATITLFALGEADDERSAVSLAVTPGGARFKLAL